MAGNELIVVQNDWDRGTRYTQVQPMGDLDVANLVSPDRYVFEIRDKFDPQTSKHSPSTHGLLQRLFQCPSVQRVVYTPNAAAGFSVYLFGWASEREQAEVISILIENLGWDENFVAIQLGMGPGTERIGYTPVQTPSSQRKSWLSMKRLLL